MERTLIVARMDRRDADNVAEIFDESDRTDLPHMLGVRERELFLFHGLYMHLISADEDLSGKLEGVRSGSLFQDVNSKLKPYIDAYDPATWNGPSDAMAHRFYSWRAAR